MRVEKQVVKNFYDGFGWERNEDGAYKDTAAFVDVRPVLRDYYHRIYLRVRRFLPPRGKHFLDAGSGAIPHPEYLEYSEGYERRVCVDLSARALSEARAKLGERGLYVMADLTRLPFKEGAFDATVCAHVLYHVPADEQEPAMRELHRTLHVGGRCVIVYAWPTSLATKLAAVFGPRAWAAAIRHLMARVPGARSAWRGLKRPAGQPGVGVSPGQPARPPLYFHPHDYRWFRGILAGEWQAEVRCWRFADRAFTSTFVGDNALGGWLLAALFRLEDLLPHLMGRAGKYPMIIIRKEG